MTQIPKLMKRIPRLYNSEEVSVNLTLSTRRDKFGDIFHCVEYVNNSGLKDYAVFNHLSSALDFIQSNFK